MKTKTPLFYLWSFIFYLLLSKAFAKPTAFKAAALCSVLCALSFAPCALSQIPQGFNYQAVARDGSGTPIVSQSLPARITIQADSLGTTVIWQELHSTVTSNSFGMINLVVGRGTRQGASTVATFSDIDWRVTPKFIKTEIDHGGWQTMGVARLWSVPYAQVAGDLAGSVKKLAVEGETSGLEEALFEVKNKDGQTVFAVYNEGVRVYVSDGAKALKGGFAVGGFGTDKAESTKYLFVGKDSVRIYLDSNPLTKGIKSGFAVGGYDLTKGTVQNYLDVSGDSVRIYIDSNPAEKKLKGGFAVGGYDMTKGITGDYFNVSGKSDAEVIYGEPRVLWYPAKEAFRSGNVLIESKDSVGLNSWASGYRSKAIGGWSQALGYQSFARGDYSTAIGKNAIADKINSFALGEDAKAKNDESYAIGRGAVASGYRSFAFGSAGVDSAGNATDVARALGAYSFAVGQGSKASGLGSLSIGVSSTAEGDFSIALGYKNKATAYGATALGRNSEASGFSSTAIGAGSIAQGSPSFSVYGLAQGDGSVAVFGKSTGMRSISIGGLTYLTEALADYSVAIGTGTIYELLGTPTKASGERAFAIGNGVEASGYGSTSIGYENIALGYYSTAMGVGTKASSAYEMVVGRYNANYTPVSTTDWNSNDRLFVIGNGTALFTRSNALTVLKNGNVGIGTSTPTLKLHVEGSTKSVTATGTSAAAGQFQSWAAGTAQGQRAVYSFYPTFQVTADNGPRRAADIVSGFNGGAWGNEFISFNVGLSGTANDGQNITTERMRIDGNGDVGIGTSTPGYRLTINGTAWCSAGAWTGSDLRWKENILPVSNVLPDIQALMPVSYDLKIDEFPQMGFEEGNQIGLIAQDVEKVYPELVRTDNNGYKSVSYEKLSVLLLAAVKEQQQQIDTQNQRIDQLSKIIDDMQGEIASLRSQ